MSKRPTSEIVARPTTWRNVILVCRKCSKKLDGGFGPGGEHALGRELKRTLRASGHRTDTRVIETKCLGLCPKGAVAVLPATDPALILAVPAGTDPAVLAARLLPPLPPPPR